MGKQEKRDERGRPPEYATLYARWTLLQRLLCEGQIPYDELADWYRDKHHKAKVTLGETIEALQDAGLPVEKHETKGVATASLPPYDVKQLWRGPGIGKRLENNLPSKRILAKRVVDFWQEHQTEMHQVILGAGTMVWEVSKELLRRVPTTEPGDQFAHVYTENLLVVREFILHNVDRHILDISVMGGQLVRSAGTLQPEKPGEAQKLTNAQAIITSFGGLTKTDFYTGETEEVGDKRANLLPGDDCKYVLIPLEWEKLGKKETPVLTSGGEQKELHSEPTQYIIFTNPPANASDADEKKREILTAWKDKSKNVKVVEVQETKPVPPTGN